MKLRNAKLNPTTLALEENALLDAWAAEVPGFIRDGLPNAGQYCLAPRKLLFVLKEVNGGQDWDLRSFLRSGGRRQTWDVVARWAQALLEPERELTWDELSQNNDRRREKVLQSICAINVKKLSGTDEADNRVIRQWASQSGSRLRAQIQLYCPDIVICCGTETPYVETMNLTPGWKMTTRGIWYFVEESGTIVISYSHPESRTKKCLLHYGLVDAVREILASEP